MGKDLKIALLGTLLVFIGGIFQENVFGKVLATVGGVIFGYYFVKGIIAWWKSR